MDDLTLPVMSMLDPRCLRAQADESSPSCCIAHFLGKRPSPDAGHHTKLDTSDELVAADTPDPTGACLRPRIPAGGRPTRPSQCRFSLFSVSGVTVDSLIDR